MSNKTISENYVDFDKDIIVKKILYFLIVQVYFKSRRIENRDLVGLVGLNLLTLE